MKGRVRTMRVFDLQAVLAKYSKKGKTQPGPESGSLHVAKLEGALEAHSEDELGKPFTIEDTSR